MTNRPYCIDLYHGDNVIDLPGKPLAGFTLVKASGVAFLDHKASQGVSATERDPRCAARRAAWMDGVAVPVTDVDGMTYHVTPRFGFYHFNGTGGASVEAANFRAAVQSIYQKGDDLCLDWETVGASGFQQPASWADDFCKATEDWCGFSMKIYGGNVPRQECLRATDTVVESLSRRRFWFCQYGTYQPALLPLPWKKAGPFQWQDDGDVDGPGPHVVPGISRYCDNSTLVGAMTVEKLVAGWGQ